MFAVASDPTTVSNDDDFGWDTRRRSTNNLLSSRLSTWLRRRLSSFGGAAAKIAYADDLRTAAVPPTQEANVTVDDRPKPTQCSAAAAARSVDALHLTPSYDCKCVSCPELADSASAPADLRRCDVCDRHQYVRKTCSDTGCKPKSAADSTSMSVDKHSRLSVPFVFVTSYTRSPVDSHPPSQNHQQQQERRQSASIARQRFISMSDSRLGNADRFTSSSVARIWKVTEFLCIGNAAAAVDDRLLCRQSVFGLVDLCLEAALPCINADRWAPCSCGNPSRHRRSVLRLSVSRTDLTDIRSCFPTINRFVDGFRRRRSDASSSSAGCVMIYCETGDTLSVLAAAQYLAAVDGQTVDQVEVCLSRAGCVTPLVEGFAAVLHSIYNQRSNISLPHHHNQQRPRHIEPSSVDVVTQMKSGMTSTSASRQQRLPRRRSETILNNRSSRPVMRVEAWPDNS